MDWLCPLLHDNIGVVSTLPNRCMLHGLVFGGQIMKMEEIGIGISGLIARSGLSDRDIADLALEWLRIESGCTVALLPMFSLSDCKGDLKEQLVYEHIFPFLDATGLIISGGDLQDMFTFRVRDTYLSFSFREWGHYMAEWMNKHCGLAPESRDQYSHTDFYDHCWTAVWLKDYVRYLRNLLSIIKKKAELAQEPS